MRQNGRTTVGLPFQKSGLAPESGNETCGGKKVLVVDNDSFVCELLAKVIRRHLGLEVAVVGCGSQAISETLTGEYDAAIIELVLPETSGVEAIRVIKEMKPDFPILAITSEAVKRRDEYVVSCGVKRLFYKPVRISSLINELKGIFMTGRDKPVDK